MKAVQQFDRRENIEERRAMEILEAILDIKQLYGDILSYLALGKVNKYRINIFKAKVLELYMLIRPKLVLKQEYSELVEMIDYFVFNPKRWKKEFTMSQAIYSFFSLYQFCENERLLETKTYTPTLQYS